MNTAQQISNKSRTDFNGAIEDARKHGFKANHWFCGVDYRFPDGSILTLRGGRVESPLPRVEINHAEFD